MAEEEESTGLEVVGKQESTDDDVVAVCAECVNIIPDRIAERDIFLQMGSHPGVCPFCKGPLLVAWRSAVPGMRRIRRNGGMLN